MRKFLFIFSWGTHSIDTEEQLMKRSCLLDSEKREIKEFISRCKVGDYIKVGDALVVEVRNYREWLWR